MCCQVQMQVHIAVNLWTVIVGDITASGLPWLPGEVQQRGTSTADASNDSPLEKKQCSLQVKHVR